MASILEVSPDGRRFFNVFDAAPENEVRHLQMQYCLFLIVRLYREMGPTNNKQQR